MLKLSKIRYIYQIAFKESDKLTFRKLEKRKSKPHIFIDLMKWYIRNKEFDRNYFIRGSDVAGSQVKEYPYLLSQKLRDEYNGLHTHSDYSILLRDKYLFHLYCQLHNIPTPDVYGTYRNGELKWMNTPQTGEMIFIKDTFGLKGANIFLAEYIGNNRIKIMNQEHDISSFLKTYSRDFLIQRRMEQHSEMSKLNPSSFNTIRIVSTLKDSEVRIHGAILKIGGVGNVYDNWHDKGVVVKINLASGKLDKTGYYKYAYFGPNQEGMVNGLENGVIFEQFTVPMINEVYQTIKKAHQAFYGIYSIGWDIGIGTKSPILIEGNNDWGSSDRLQHMYGAEVIRDIFQNDIRLKNRLS